MSPYLQSNLYIISILMRRGYMTQSCREIFKFQLYTTCILYINSNIIHWLVRKKKKKKTENSYLSSPWRANLNFYKNRVRPIVKIFNDLGGGSALIGWLDELDMEKDFECEKIVNHATSRLWSRTPDGRSRMIIGRIRERYALRSKIIE